MDITPRDSEECSKISCIICHFKDTTIYGYGFHIDGTPFPLYDFSRCEHKKQLEDSKIHKEINGE